jgi:hypothetical protein
VFQLARGGGRDSSLSAMIRDRGDRDVIVEVWIATMECLQASRREEGL